MGFQACAQAQTVQRVGVQKENSPAGDMTAKGWLIKNAGYLIGAVCIAPISPWGFVIGGFAFGIVSSGYLAIPGAFIGMAIVFVAGAWIGNVLYLFIRNQFGSKL